MAVRNLTSLSLTNDWNSFRATPPEPKCPTQFSLGLRLSRRRSIDAEKRAYRIREAMTPEGVLARI